MQTDSAGRAKKDGGGCAGMVLVAMGVAWGMGFTIDKFLAKGSERKKSRAMQIYAYPHKPQFGR